jgi:hypothetical protein
MSMKTIDVYDVLDLWGVTCPAIQHAIKKLLMPGQRGSKDEITDLEEAALAIERAIEMANVRQDVATHVQPKYEATA